MHIILASASPRRRELLSQIGLEYEVAPSTVKEEMEGALPAEIVQGLAVQKAEENLIDEFVSSARARAGIGA